MSHNEKNIKIKNLIYDCIYCVCDVDEQLTVGCYRFNRRLGERALILTGKVAFCGMGLNNLIFKERKKIKNLMS